MHRILAIFLLVLLPFQSSWAAVASYCTHEEQAGASHFGHHEHEHHADASNSAEPGAGLEASAGGKAPGAADLDCGHCHGYCSVMPAVLREVPVALSMAPPSAALEEGGGAHAPTRPERPQWRPLA